MSLLTLDTAEFDKHDFTIRGLFALSTDYMNKRYGINFTPHQEEGRINQVAVFSLDGEVSFALMHDDSWHPKGTTAISFPSEINDADASKYISRIPRELVCMRGLSPQQSAPAP
jgi:hypothetical protein